MIAVALPDKWRNIILNDYDMKTKFLAGSAAKTHNSRLWFNFIPYVFIDVRIWNNYSKVLVIQCGWLFWDMAVMFIK